jgi:23S rRNA (cytosine1962-C5)-methyltransferase
MRSWRQPADKSDPKNPDLGAHKAMQPVTKLLPRSHKRIAAGRPWIYSNEIQMTDEAKSLEPGAITGIVSDAGEWMGQATFNPHALICGRIVTRDRDVTIDSEFLITRLAAALHLRERLFDEPYYRLANSEADELPGMIIDRYGQAVSIQLNTAGAERLKGDLLLAVESVLAPETIVFRNDSPARSLEGLEMYSEVAKGFFDEPIHLTENGTVFFADLLHGQKTGWFYDQRMNRTFVASLANGLRLLDCYGHTGGFAVQAAVRGATETVVVDTSASALELASKSASENSVADRVHVHKADVFLDLVSRAARDERYDVVVADPPSFVKSKRDLKSGSRGYRKLARLAAKLVSPGGVLFIASCSHNVSIELFNEQIVRGVADARRTGRILMKSGASPDHPLHPGLPESAYLKATTFQLD